VYQQSVTSLNFCVVWFSCCFSLYGFVPVWFSSWVYLLVIHYWISPVCPLSAALFRVILSVQFLSVIVHVTSVSATLSYSCGL